MLLGQNVNDYYGKIDDSMEGNLALLIQTISQIPGIERIRFTTSHPQAFDDTLIDAYEACNTKLCNHALTCSGEVTEFLKTWARLHRW